MKRFSLAGARAKADARARDWAEVGQAFAAYQHENAPRGGRNLNKYGEPRSAPGEPPAVEEGDLLAAIQSPPERDNGGWVFVVNRVGLEFGEITPEGAVLPRPLGEITLHELRVMARS